MKKLSYDFVLSIIGLVLSIFPLIASFIYVDIGSPGRQSLTYEDLPEIYAAFVTVMAVGAFIVMVILSLVNDLAIKNINSQKTFRIIITVIDIVGILITLGSVILFPFL